MDTVNYDSVNEDDFSEWLPQPERSGPIADEEVEHQDTKKRGRKAVPLCWTRVINVTQEGLADARVHPISTDLLVASGLPTVPRSRRE